MRTGIRCLFRGEGNVNYYIVWSVKYRRKVLMLSEKPFLCEEYKTVHSQVLQNVVERLDKAYQAFFRRLKH
ncbi:hypothetical protein ACH33_04660 [Aneurinibacillus sp. XH2]|nr:hypothetical protein ACH33_04660 [Aneurinibacillus sp. XH2]